MTFSAAPDAAAADEIRGLAARLCGRPVTTVAAVNGGGNNRLYSVSAGGAAFALKCYGAIDARGDRLGREFDGLSFLAERAVTAVPAAVAADLAARAALYQWIDGESAAATDGGGGYVEQALAFVAALRRVSRRSDSSDWRGEAAEACLSAAALRRQIAGRLERLQGLADEPMLANFLSLRLIPTQTLALQRLQDLYAVAGLDPQADIPPAARILSPSDFGFHNALRRPDGRLVFVDFEYFGWDDPVKLTADFLWHPGMRLDDSARTAWAAGMAALFMDDPTFAVRLSAQIPLFALRWCLIILNEFLPERRRRRVFAGQAAADDNWSRIKAAQLTKADALLTRAVGPCGAAASFSIFQPSA